MERAGTIFGAPADQAVRVGLTVMTIGLNAGSIVSLSVGAPKLASLLALTGGLLGASLAIGQMCRDEQDRRTLASTIARLEALHA